MKKFLLLLIAIATVSVLIGCKGKKEKSDTYNYDRILKGNLSDFEGNWVNENGDSMRLLKNGTTHPKQAAGNFRKTEEGVYNWNVWAEEGGGFFLALYPVNIDAIKVFDFEQKYQKIFLCETLRFLCVLCVKKIVIL